MKEKRTNLTTSTDRFMKPFIPNGFTYVTGSWNNGFVISDKFGNEFVWVPVGWLEENGTLDGLSFNSKLGLRNWYNYDFSSTGWHEDIPQNIVESILYWEGFYTSRNTASLESGKVVFKTGNIPLVELSYNYANNDKFYSNDGLAQLLPTGSHPEWSIYNINDLAGNVLEFTQEQHNTDRIVLRGGHYRVNGRDYPIGDRYFREPPTTKVNIAGFRSMLFHK